MKHKSLSGITPGYKVIFQLIDIQHKGILGVLRLVKEDISYSLRPRHKGIVGVQRLVKR